MDTYKRRILLIVHSRTVIVLNIYKWLTRKFIVKLKAVHWWYINFFSIQWYSLFNQYFKWWSIHGLLYNMLRSRPWSILNKRQSFYELAKWASKPIPWNEHKKSYTRLKRRGKITLDYVFMILLLNKWHHKNVFGYY